MSIFVDVMYVKPGLANLFEKKSPCQEAKATMSKSTSAMETTAKYIKLVVPPLCCSKKNFKKLKTGKNMAETNRKSYSY